QVSIVRLVDLILECGYIARASDIHIEPEPENVTVRFRIDGLLRNIFDQAVISKPVHQEIISRIKVIAGLRTDEHSLPQDGRFKINIEEFGDVDVRVSI